MKVYNTLNRKKEDFAPKGKINMFVCGPTVYDDSHIGHGKTYTQFDVIVRYLRWKGHDIFYLMNITDIDDKIINRAKERGVDWKELADKYEKRFYEDMKILGNNSVNEFANATDYIPQIIKQVQDLMDKGYGYEISDGIYFEIDKFKEYGKLSKQNLKQIKIGARIDENKEKKNPADFVLWKKHKPGEPFWVSPWGKGRPGWHIEDTAITETEFGPQYDLHGGAVDLIFPHHECEIAQMESASGKKPLVKYWLHTAFLNLDEEKMSKSLGNIIPIRQAIENFGADALRYYYAVHHYRTPLEYSDKNVEQARNSLERINNFIQDVMGADGSGENVSLHIKRLMKNFEERMDDDFDTPGAIAAVFDFVRDVNKLDIGKENKEELLEAMKEINKVFNVFSFEEVEVPHEVIELVEQREKARLNKEWDKSDELRDKIKEKGFAIEDTPQGPRVKKV